MLTRQEYVAVCEKCAKRKFDRNKGIVCSLTNEHANFESTCTDFETDPEAIKRIERTKNHTQEMAMRQTGGNTYKKRDYFIAEKKMMNGGVAGGIMMVVGGLVWLIGGLTVNIVFYYPLFLIIGGIIVIIKNAAKKVNELSKPDTSGILDDKKDMEVF